MRTRSFLHWSGGIFCLVGIIALSCVGSVLAHTRLYQAYLTRRFEQELKLAKMHTGSREDVPSSLLHQGQLVEGSVLEGFPLGRIEISNIGLSAMIMEGTAGKTLRQAVGHIPGTALPGQQGNIGIAGHRDTFFRGLRNIHKDDEITLTTLNGTYHYRVDTAQVVKPEGIAVLDHSDEPILTMVTCYPFFFVGPAPMRFVVRAHRIPG